MSRVLPRYQDRRVCTACGSVVERWMHESDSGREVNAPVLFPLDRLNWTPPASDCELVTRRNDLVRMARLDYFCRTCACDLTASQTRPIVGELPAHCFYEPVNPLA